MKNVSVRPTWYCNKVSKEDVINVGKWPRRLVLDEWIRYHGYFLRNINDLFKCAMSLAKQVQISMVFISTLLHIFYQLQNQAFNIGLGWRQIFAMPRFLSIGPRSVFHYNSNIPWGRIYSLTSHILKSYLESTWFVTPYLLSLGY